MRAWRCLTRSTTNRRDERAPGGSPLGGIGAVTVRKLYTPPTLVAARNQPTAPYAISCICTPGYDAAKQVLNWLCFGFF